MAKAENDFTIKVVFDIDQQKKLEPFLTSAKLDLQKPEEFFSKEYKLSKSNDIWELFVQFSRTKT